MAELQLKGLTDNEESWTSLDDINDVFRNKDTPLLGILRVVPVEKKRCFFFFNPATNLVKSSCFFTVDVAHLRVLNDLDGILGPSCMVTENFSPDYVQQHWKEDDFFAYQYLNGPHPTLIQRCKTLPGNFPVTDDMVFIPDGSNLSNELQVKSLSHGPHRIL